MLASLLLPTLAWADADFGLLSPEWNGLSALLSIAGDFDVKLSAADALDFSALDEREVLLLVAPQQGPDEAARVELHAFLRAGGKLIVADDFRAGRMWVAPFGITWRDLPGRSPHSFEGNPALPTVTVDAGQSVVEVAKRWRGPRSRYVPTSFLGHNLKAGVVLNHPASLQVAPGDRAVVWGSFGDEPNAGGWLAEAAQGEGRVLALADASWLINQMIGRVYDNRQFAANLLRYYCVEERPCKVKLIANLQRTSGQFAPQAEVKTDWRSGLELLQRWLHDLAELLRGDLVAPGLLALLAWMLGHPVARRARTMAALLPPKTELPRTTSALSEKLTAWMREPMADYRKPAALLAHQLERLLERIEPGLGADRARMAGAPQRRSGSWRRDDGMVDLLVHGGRWSPQAGERLRQVLTDLQALAQDHAPMVSRQQFGQLASEVEWAESLLRHTVVRAAASAAQQSSGVP